MFLTLFWQSVRRSLLTFRFAAALIVLFSLTLISISINTSNYLDREQTYRSLVFKAEEEQRDKHIASRISPRVYWPPSRLSIFIQGEEQRLGNAVEIHRWRVPTRASDSLEDNELLAGLQQFDMLTVFSTALTLLGLLLSFDAISGERENGMLKLILANRVQRATLFTAKYSALVTLLLLALVISMLSGLVVVLFVFGVHLTAMEYGAVAAILLSGVVMGGIAVGLGMLMSALFSRSSQALLASLVLWMALALILPVTAIDMARATVELRNPNELSTASRETEAEIRQKMYEYRVDEAPNSLGFMGDGYQSAEIYVYDAPEDVWEDARKFFVFYENLYQRRADALYNLWREHQAERRRQAEQAARYSWLTPFHHLRSGLTGLAETGYQDYEENLALARRYREQMLNLFRSRGYFGENAIDFFSRRPARERTQAGFESRLEQFQQAAQQGESVIELLSPEVFEPLPDSILPGRPEFTTQPDFQAIVLPIGTLTIMALVIFISGVVFFNRYDIR